MKIHLPFLTKGVLFFFFSLAKINNALLLASESSTRLTLSNDRLTASVNKSDGTIDLLTLDNQDLLGPRNASIGIGPYLDCYCIPSGFYTPGSIAPQYSLLNGTDSTGISWGGIILHEIYPPTGQIFEQYWFLRDGETGLHMWSRVAYFNSSKPFLRNLQELRTLFRPNSNLWTHLSTNEEQFAPLPYHNPAAGSTAGNATTVQDATWKINNASDPYVLQESDYFTKYTFSDVWREHIAHGLFADGSTSADKSTWGAWFVMNSRDTYFGGPTHSDLTVDGIVYNYIVSNHHGAQTPNITDGFDRTFGPGFYYFNRGLPGTSLEESRRDAERFVVGADEEEDGGVFAKEFYESVAEFVTGYIPHSKRGSWSGIVNLPMGAEKPIAILSVSGMDYQDNAQDVHAFQYWADIDPITGAVAVDGVVAGTYRLTIYARGIFGFYAQDDILIDSGSHTFTSVTWEQESAAAATTGESAEELWRIGIPDQSSGEFLHGYARDPTHPLHPAEHRIYWAVYDYLQDFPHGVNFTIGTSDISQDFNYVHWSVFGGRGNSLRPEAVWGDGNVNNWTLGFDLGDAGAVEATCRNRTQGVFTVQLAAAKTAAGNTDVFNETQKYSDLPFAVGVNGVDLEPWIIPYVFSFLFFLFRFYSFANDSIRGTRYYHSSSCAVRSAVICYNLAHKFVFDIGLLKQGRNEIVLSLPFNATDYESALLAESVYVQYDALRLEVR